MSHGFIKLNREEGQELLEGDPKSFLLLSQIALRARRKDADYSRIPLKANQAFIGDHDKIGLSRQEYRTAQKKLVEYGIATFKPTNKGTIATLTSTAVFDINAEENSPSEQPSPFSMKNQKKEPTKNQRTSSEKPINNLRGANEEPPTRKEETEEYKKATTSDAGEGALLYKCLEKFPNLTLEEKTTLLKYTEDRIEKALEWVSKTKIKTTFIQALHWHCQQPIPPAIQESSQISKNDPEAAAWEYNLFLQNHGYEALANKNQTAIAQHHAYIISDGRTTTISLRNPIETVRTDFTNSMNEVLTQKGVHHG